MLISEIKACGICKYLRDNVQNSHHDMHSVEKFTLTEKKFRQINYLVIL